MEIRGFNMHDKQNMPQNGIPETIILAFAVMETFAPFYSALQDLTQSLSNVFCLGQQVKEIVNKLVTIQMSP